MASTGSCSPPVSAGARPSSSGRLCRYLLQTGLPFSQRYMESVLARHPAIAARLVWTFEARFDPALKDSTRASQLRSLGKEIDEALEQVTSPDDDRILRAFRAVIGAALRTNHYQVDASGRPKPYLSLKLDPKSLPELPKPRPMFEIWVYSPRVEGVHLRMGKVARGGLRWSDRREDFRTEVLGLMKAQNVKNTVIVPVGSKGGFFPKQLPAGNREAIQREGTECYKTFIRGLLDLTDNVKGNEVVPPALTVRYDPDDPYLVVAADKGTATFSDTANALSAEYGFWLGDAFASGGSAGYDHKKMGITAKGGWECVKRHFREMGIDIQSQDFTVAGIGDMAGDVFGNGMLLSRHIRLLAAFNHQHIFLDPDPDAELSFRERERLFNLPRSAWSDYDARVISKGGGVYPKDAKEIALSPQARAMLGIDSPKATPQQVIVAILKLPVDLLWNGGIGTYVKASWEANSAIGDRSNDAVRVDGRDLRCKVIGEGGNLGLSQLGRIEFALKGGRMNTDFVDNSGGVDCSDHEVNIKILLDVVQRRTKLPTAARNRLLADMTDDVGALVLRDNYLQSQALSLLEAVAPERLGEHAHFIRSLELEGVLDRALEFLPSSEDIEDRRRSGLGLTRPELSIVLSYAKIALASQLIRSDVPEDPYLSRELDRYFPDRLARRYAGLLGEHRLRREIIVTATTNSIVNRMGPDVRGPHPAGHRLRCGNGGPRLLDCARGVRRTGPVDVDREARQQDRGTGAVRDGARHDRTDPAGHLLADPAAPGRPRHRDAGRAAASRHPGACGIAAGVAAGTRAAGLRCARCGTDGRRGPAGTGTADRRVQFAAVCPGHRRAGRRAEVVRGVGGRSVLRRGRRVRARLAQEPDREPGH